MPAITGVTLETCENDCAGNVLCRAFTYNGNVERKCPRGLGIEYAQKLFKPDSGCLIENWICRLFFVQVTSRQPRPGVI